VATVVEVDPLSLLFSMALLSISFNTSVCPPDKDATSHADSPVTSTITLSTLPSVFPTKWYPYSEFIHPLTVHSSDPDWPLTAEKVQAILIIFIKKYKNKN